METTRTKGRGWVVPRRVLWAALAIAISGAAIHAHHSIVSVYDSSKQVTIDGVVKEFHFVNPHPFVTVDVKDVTGVAQQWQADMDNRWELVGIGMTSETLKPGDRVIVLGSRARSQARSLYVRRLERPADGFSYEQVGNSPRIR